jgi:hypothetical protein
MQSVQYATGAELLDIDLAKVRVPEDDTLFAELRDVLETHDALSRFGIVLLHQHFSVGDDEILVETCDPVKRTLQCTVQRKAEINAGPIIETNWRLDVPSVLAVCARVCQSSRDSGHVQGHVSANQS